jgi:hypothetical protein
MSGGIRLDNITSIDIKELLDTETDLEEKMKTLANWAISQPSSF